MTRPSADLVVLAYSGGLDTTVTVHRLVHEQGRAADYGECRGPDSYPPLQ